MYIDDLLDVLKASWAALFDGAGQSAPGLVCYRAARRQRFGGRVGHGDPQLSPDRVDSDASPAVGTSKRVAPLGLPAAPRGAACGHSAWGAEEACG